MLDPSRMGSRAQNRNSGRSGRQHLGFVLRNHVRILTCFRCVIPPQIDLRLSPSVEWRIAFLAFFRAIRGKASERKTVGPKVERAGNGCREKAGPNLGPPGALKALAGFLLGREGQEVRMKVARIVLALTVPGWAFGQTVTVTGTSVQITTNPAGQINPAISGSIVAYTDFQDGSPDVYYTDLTTGKESAATSAGGANRTSWRTSPGIPSSTYTSQRVGMRTFRASRLVGHR